MEPKNRSMAKTAALCTKDIFRVMPGIVICTAILQLISAAVSVALVKLIAMLIDSAAKEPLVLDDLLNYTFMIIGCYVINVCSDKISYHINNIDSVPKFETYHHRLSAFTVSLSLEAAENPEISSMFWRAKDAVYQDRMGSVWNTVFGIVPKLFQLIGTSMVLFDYYPGLVPLALLSIVPIFIIRMIVGKKQYQLSRQQTAKNRLSNYLWGVLTDRNAIKEMRCMGFSEYLTNRYFDVSKEVFEENRRFEQKSASHIFWGNFIKTLFYGFSIGLCIVLLKNSIITIGAFAACLSAFTGMQGTSETMLSSFSALKQQCNYANDYYDFFAFATEKTEKTPCRAFEKVIQAKNISFRYPNSDQNAIDNVNLTIKSGEKIAIVGENGSGKTTLSKLLLGLYTPTSGTIEIDGVDALQYTDSYYQNFSLVAQRFGKYSISMRDNVAFGEISRNSDTVGLTVACETAGIMDVVNEIGGFYAELGVEFGGKELSGGQWQKTAIARGYFRNGKICFMDEPTSALDPVIEYDILTDFINLSKEKAAVIISHRIGICSKVDRVIVMSKGKIVESGSHSELLRQDGVYASLWREQAKWYQ